MHKYGADKKISTAKDLRKLAAVNIYHKNDMSREEYMRADLSRRGESAKVIDLALSEPKGKPLTPFINHSRLVVTCPYCGAGMAWAVDEDFYCHECMMVSNNGKPRPVISQKRLGDTMRLLENRPKFYNRNLGVNEGYGEINLENKKMKIKGGK